MTAVGAADVERVFRDEYGRAVSVLVRLLGDIDLAEEAVQEAFVAAVRRWPVRNPTGVYIGPDSVVAPSSRTCLISAASP